MSVHPRHVLPILLLAFACSGCGGGAIRSPQDQPAGDAQLRQLNDAAYTAYRQGMIDQAARLYAQALSRARLIDDAPASVNAAYNEAYARFVLEQYDEAAAALNEVVAIAPSASPTDVEDAIGDALMLHARIAQRRNQPREAELLMAESLSRLGEGRSRRRFEAAILQGHLAVDRNDPPAAQERLDEAARSASSRPLELAALRARVADLRGPAGAAAPIYDEEADLAQSAGAYARMTRALSDAGADYAEAEQWKAAANRCYRAARSAESRGDRTLARELAERAAEAAERGDERAVRIAARDLIARLGPGDADAATDRP